MTAASAVVLIALLHVPGALAAQSGSDASQPLPAEIPIFPLQDVTLFPNSTQPFHIFEPRYRAMVADALASDSVIGMVLLQPGFEAQYEGRPPVFAVGCAGVIIAAEQLADGRYNIVLRGLTKFRILAEDEDRSYRVAQVEEIPEVVAEGDRPLLAQWRAQIDASLLSAFPGAPPPPTDMTDEEVVDGISLILPMEPSERQLLLEANGPVERASNLARLLRRGPLSSL